MTQLFYVTSCDINSKVWKCEMARIRTKQQKNYRERKKAQGKFQINCFFTKTKQKNLVIENNQIGLQDVCFFGNVSCSACRRLLLFTRNTRGSESRNRKLIDTYTYTHTQTHTKNQLRIRRKNAFHFLYNVYRFYVIICSAYSLPMAILGKRLN